MAFTLIAGGSNRGLLQTPSVVHIDATTNITPRFSNQVTKHPVESGGTISDHAFQQNTEIDVTGCIVNYPINGSGEADFRRVEDQYRLLRRIWSTREFTTIRSELEAYQNCILTSMSFPRTPQVGDSLEFNLTFEQVQVVSPPQSALVSDEIIDRILRPQKVGNKEIVDSESEGNSEQDQGLFDRIGNYFRTNFSEATRVVTDFGQTSLSPPQ